MIRDATHLGRDSQLQADICVIGAGAAGITIATELTKTGLSTIILEGGNEQYTTDSQSLYAGKNIGRPYYETTSTRLRFFGGSTNHYAGDFAPLDVLDYEKRPGLPETGWPISQQELAPYYGAAHRYCQLGPEEMDPEYWTDRLGYRALDFDASLFRSKIRQTSPTRFATAYKEILDRSENVHVYLNANVIDILFGNTEDLIDRVSVVDQQGKPFSVRSKCFILATGGLENPRVLLNANSQRTSGIGNEFDLVGRYFMEHIGVESGLISFAENAFDENFYTYGHVEIPRDLEAPQAPLGIQGFLCAQPEVLRRENLANVRMSFRQFIKTRQSNTALRAGKSFISDLLRFRKRPEPASDLSRALSNLDVVAGEILGLPSVGNKALYKPTTIIEQLPNRSSRILLGDDRDRYGNRQLEIDWHWSEADRRTIAYFQKLVAWQLGVTGIGRMRLELGNDPVDFGVPFHKRDKNGNYQRAGNHHIGTTRMAANPRSGVTDSNCRVHSTKNLFIAGSSVFPTAGLWNPTLTIVALAVRLTDHLTKEYS